MYFKMLSANVKVSFKEFEFMPHGYLLYHIPFPPNMMFNQVKKIVSKISQLITGKVESD